jgi:hypothetical protein
MPLLLLAYGLGVNKMTLYDKIIAAYPELTDADFDRDKGSIGLRDDSDGVGAYIEKWEYSKPIPNGLKLGK